MRPGNAFLCLSRKNHLRWQVGIFVFSLWLAGCSAAPSLVPTLMPTLSPTNTHQPLPSATPQATPTAAPTNTPAPRICSPLADYALADLPGLVSNPFHPPHPGSDDPHQGIDLAVQQYGMAVAGHTVQAILTGQVAAVMAERFPYGNALVIETRLADLPQGLPEALPTPAPTLPPHPVLTCPPLAVGWDTAQRSLYVLYAHMQAPPAIQMGEPVTCGAPLGAIGQSGNALNPHLHIEVRTGPSGAHLDSLAHYDSSANPEEMGAYCAWRVSGVFQLVDPGWIIK